MQQKIYLMRHSERPDNFKKSFVDWSFDTEGNYLAHDLNHPPTLPERADGFEAFRFDPPLAETGFFTSNLVGRGYKAKGIKIDRIYSSPSLRCVQTATGFIQGYGADLKISVETGLFEFMWPVYKEGHPSWMTVNELLAAGYPMEEKEQILDGSDLKPGESWEECYRRSDQVIRALISRHPGESILCIGHGSTLECCSRLLTGKEPRAQAHLFHVLMHCGFLANIEMVEKEDGLFEITGCPVKPLTTQAFEPFQSEVHHLEGDDLEEDIKNKAEHFKSKFKF